MRRAAVAVFRIGMEFGERLERMRRNGALEAAANRPRHLRPVKYVQPLVDDQGRYMRAYTQKIHKSANKLQTKQPISPKHKNGSISLDHLIV